jgi:hypothetical protein
MRIESKSEGSPGEFGLPARASSEKAAEMLGFATHDIPILIAARLLKPLGAPAPNAPKYFASCDLLQLSIDRDWLNKATKAVAESWRVKNQNRRVKAQEEVDR